MLCSSQKFIRFATLLSACLAAICVFEQSVNAQTGLLQKRNADDLRPAPGLPIVPTIAIPLTFGSRPTEINFAPGEFNQTATVVPFTPIASPISSTRNPSGAFTTDPVRAVPIIQTQTDRNKP
jgi:hypothetical protein